MRLRELQIECAEDALQQLKAIRGGDLYQSYDAPEDAESQRHEHIEIVERFIVALKQADQPIINTDLPYQFIQKRP